MPNVKTSYKVPYRRRKEKKTNYKTRLALVRSGKTRIVIRKSLSHINIQFIDYFETGDKTLLTVNSKVLKKMGWKFNTGNLPAAYLAGYICGKKAKESGITNAILDLGLYKSVRGSRIYAALKGILDAGIEVKCSEDIIPKEDRIKGKHISEEVSKNFEEVLVKIKGDDRNP